MRNPINRRSFLRGAGGVAISLPLLEAMAPRAYARAQGDSPPMRMVCIGNPLGMLPDAFFPKSTGADYEMPELLKPLEQHREKFTVFSHLDHDVSGGHSAVHSFLSGIKDQDASDWPERNISIDQRAAEFVGAQTRFPSLVASVGDPSGTLGCQLSWTRNGVNVPPVSRASRLFRALFLADDADSRKKRADAYDTNASILDAVQQQAKLLERQLGNQDRQKLDEYLTSVREVERKLGMSSAWLDKPKPDVEMSMPDDGPFTQSLSVFYELLVLAMQTDSTRVAALEIPGTIDTGNLGLSGGYHGFSHHGKAEVLQKGLLVIEQFQTRHFAGFLDRLAELRDPDGSAMLDRTMVLLGSGMGNGSSHSNRNLPILLAGGGFRHGRHVALPTDRRVPLCNLFATMLQRFGLEVDQFNKSTGTLSGLEVA